ncbi:hypothetical protein D3C86_1597850 [compost metagenome]
MQRLVHGRAAQAEQRGHLGLDQRLAGTELARDDAALDLRVRLLAQGRAALGWRGGRGGRCRRSCRLGVGTADQSNRVRHGLLASSQRSLKLQ